MAISSLTATQIGAYTGSMALGLLQTGVTSSTQSALFGVSGTSTASTYSADDLFGLNTGSSYVSVAGDTFASILSNQGDSQVTLSIKQATARIKAQAQAKIAQGQQQAGAIKSVTA
jgi:hypothetical protein